MRRSNQNREVGIYCVRISQEAGFYLDAYDCWKQCCLTALCLGLPSRHLRAIVITEQLQVLVHISQITLIFRMMLLVVTT